MDPDNSEDTSSSAESSVNKPNANGPSNETSLVNPTNESSTTRTVDEIIRSRQAERNLKEHSALIAWTNTYLSKRSLSGAVASDYSDGVLLLNLLSVSLSDNSIISKVSLTPKLPAQKLDNMARAFSVIEKNNIRLLSVNAHDLVAGKEKQIMIVLFALLRFLSLRGLGLALNQSSNSNNGANAADHNNSSSMRDALLKWCQNSFPNLTINDFWSSFRDGKVFCAIVDKVAPGSIDLENKDSYYNQLTEPKDRIKLAFDKAEAHLKIPSFIQSDEFNSEKGDEKSVMNYVCMLVSAANAAQVTNHSKSVQEELVNEKLRNEEKLRLEMEIKQKEMEARQLKAEEESRRLTEELKSNSAKLLSVSEQEEKWKAAVQQWETSTKQWREGHDKYKALYEAKCAELEEFEKKYLIEKAEFEAQIHKLNSYIYKQHREQEEVLSRIREDKIRDLAEMTTAVSESKHRQSFLVSMMKNQKAIKQAKTDYDLLTGMERKRGWLCRRRPNKVFGKDKFKRQYFILKGDILEYYKDAEPTTKLKGSINLADYKLCAPIASELSDTGNAIYRLEVKSKNKSANSTSTTFDFYVLEEDSVPLGLTAQVATKQWVDTINTHIAILNYIQKKETYKNLGWIGAPELIHFICDPYAAELIIDRVVNLTDPLLTLRPALAAQSRLTFVGLTDCNLEDASVPVIADILLSSHALTGLDLSGNFIGAEGVQALKVGLMENKSLVRLTLNHNKLGSAGLIILSEAVKVHPAIHEIDLIGNQIDDQGIIAYCQALKEKPSKPTNQNDSLNEFSFPILNLSENLIADQGAEAIADLISKKNSITKLILDHNVIGDHGLTAISNAISSLGSSCEVILISLASNQIGSRGLYSLADALKTLDNHITVDLSNNKLATRSGISAIVNNDLLVDYKLLKIYKPKKDKNFNQDNMEQELKIKIDQSKEVQEDNKEKEDEQEKQNKQDEEDKDEGTVKVSVDHSDDAPLPFKDHEDNSNNINNVADPVPVSKTNSSPVPVQSESIPSSSADVAANSLPKAAASNSAPQVTQATTDEFTPMPVVVSDD